MTLATIENRAPQGQTLGHKTPSQGSEKRFALDTAQKLECQLALIAHINQSKLADQESQTASA